MNYLLRLDLCISELIYLHIAVNFKLTSFLVSNYKLINVLSYTIKYANVEQNCLKNGHRYSRRESRLVILIGPTYNGLMCLGACTPSVSPDTSVKCFGSSLNIFSNTIKVFIEKEKNYNFQIVWNLNYFLSFGTYYSLKTKLSVNNKKHEPMKI